MGRGGSQDSQGGDGELALGWRAETDQFRKDNRSTWGENDDETFKKHGGSYMEGVF